MNLPSSFLEIIDGTKEEILLFLTNLANSSGVILTI
jgi:hypothetical protein